MKKYIYLGAILIGSFGACTKDSYKSSGNNPYVDPVQPAISLKKDGIAPNTGVVGDLVVIGGRNFLKNKDNISFLFNNVKADVVELTDTTAKVKIPQLASTGNITVLVGQEYYYGPFFRVKGIFELDTLFPGNTAGANGDILDIIPVENGKYLMVGDFDRYGSTDNDGKGMKRVVRINKDGKWDEVFAKGFLNGSNSVVRTATALKNSPYYLVAGGFSSYGGVSYCSNLAAVYSSTGGAVSDKVVNPATNTEYTVSLFKGGVDGGIGSMSVTEGPNLQSSKLLLTGDFRFFIQPNFKLTNYLGKDSIHIDSVQISGIVRLNGDGGLDSTFNYDLVNHRGKDGPNGFINYSKVLPDGKILISGSFTKYNGQAANRIARLNHDGSLDPTFNVGAGPDMGVGKFVIQPDGKILVIGAFNNFGGVKARQVARLNADGSVDPSFSVGDGTEDFVTSIDLMPGGEIIVGGFFTKFNGYYRNNVIVLNANGSVHPTYNSSGGITMNAGKTGLISKVLPIDGEKSLFVVGSFSLYDYRSVQRLIKIKYQ